MNTNKLSSKDSLKGLYQELKEKIRLILGILGALEEKKTSALDDLNVQRLAHLLNDVLNNCDSESNLQYREAIFFVSSWMKKASQKNFLQANYNCSPHPSIVLKKGAETLHSLFHRDLRRKNLSGSEEELYRRFVCLTKTIPSPFESFDEQTEANELVGNLLKSS